jgi:hypothetical protein
VTWYADLTPYVYMEPEPNTLNVGWLDAAMPFLTGETEAQLVERLRDICRAGINRTRGLHRCNLCPAPTERTWPPEPNRVTSDHGEYVVGGAEIRVRDGDGTIYAAPDMIIHYVQAHNYKPPDPFIAAVIGWEVQT